MFVVSLLFHYSAYPCVHSHVYIHNVIVAVSPFSMGRERTVYLVNEAVITDSSCLEENKIRSSFQIYQIYLSKLILAMLKT